MNSKLKLHFYILNNWFADEIREWEKFTPDSFPNFKILSKGLFLS